MDAVGFNSATSVSMRMDQMCVRVLNSIWPVASSILRPYKENRSRARQNSLSSGGSCGGPCVPVLPALPVAVEKSGPALLDAATSLAWRTGRLLTDRRLSASQRSTTCWPRTRAYWFLCVSAWRANTIRSDWAPSVVCNLSWMIQWSHDPKTSQNQILDIIFTKFRFQGYIWE